MSGAEKAVQVLTAGQRVQTLGGLPGSDSVIPPLRVRSGSGGTASVCWRGPPATS